MLTVKETDFTHLHDANTYKMKSIKFYDVLKIAQSEDHLLETLQDFDNAFLIGEIAIDLSREYTFEELQAFQAYLYTIYETLENQQALALSRQQLSRLVLAEIGIDRNLYHFTDLNRIKLYYSNEMIESSFKEELIDRLKSIRENATGQFISYRFSDKYVQIVE